MPKKPDNRQFSRLVSIMSRLLAPDGCPWDRKQTHSTLLKYLYEEADEAAQAVKKRDWENLKEELGDLLLQVVFHAELARRAGRFDINDVVEGINAKMIRRHPHVFGGPKLKTGRQVLLQWEEIKKMEKAGKAIPSAVKKTSRPVKRR